MKKKILCLILVIAGYMNGSAQHYTYLNFDYKNPALDSIQQLLDDYFNHPGDVAKYWAQADIATYPSVDVLEYSTGLSGSLYQIGFKANTLGIYPFADGYMAKVMLYWDVPDTINSKHNKINVLAIANYLVVRENGQYKLSNYINYATKNWYYKQVGIFKYICHPAHPFDRFKANDANLFAAKIREWFTLPVTDTLTYFIAANCTETNKIVGFEYFEGEGGEGINLCGYIDQKNNIIYSNTIAGENYEHEIIHIINKHFNNAHKLIKIGLSAYINNAGSRNKPLQFHIKRYMEYAKQNKVDLNNFHSLYYMDEVTNPNYVFGGLICNALVRKGGPALLKKAMENTKEDAALDSFLKKELGVNDLSVFFFSEADIFLKQKGVLLNTHE